MSKPTSRFILFPCLLMALGTGWLLTVLNVLPGVNWPWIILLAGAGLLPLFMWGVDAATFPLSGFLLACTFASLLRQTGQLHADIETPILVIGAGFLMFVGHFLPLSRPIWLIGPEPKPSPSQPV